MIELLDLSHESLIHELVYFFSTGKIVVDPDHLVTLVITIVFGRKVRQVGLDTLVYITDTSHTTCFRT